MKEPIVRSCLIPAVFLTVFDVVSANPSPGILDFDGLTSGAQAGPGSSVSFTTNGVTFSGSGSGIYSINIAAGGGAQTGGLGDQYLQVNRSSGIFSEQRITSDDGTEFSLETFEFNPFGPGGNSASIQFEGFKNNVSTGTQTETIAYATWTTIDLTTSGNFDDVDDIVITHTGGLGNFGAQFDVMNFAAAVPVELLRFEVD